MMSLARSLIFFRAPGSTAVLARLANYGRSRRQQDSAGRLLPAGAVARRGAACCWLLAAPRKQTKEVTVASGECL